MSTVCVVPHPPPPPPPPPPRPAPPPPPPPPPGLFTGSTGATVLTSEELSSSGPQAWLKKVPLVAGARRREH